MLRLDLLKTIAEARRAKPDQVAGIAGALVDVELLVLRHEVAVRPRPTVLNQPRSRRRRRRHR